MDDYEARRRQAIGRIGKAINGVRTLVDKSPGRKCWESRRLEVLALLEGAFDLLAALADPDDLLDEMANL